MRHTWPVGGANEISKLWEFLRPSTRSLSQIDGVISGINADSVTPGHTENLVAGSVNWNIGPGSLDETPYWPLGEALKKENISYEKIDQKPDDMIMDHVMENAEYDKLRLSLLTRSLARCQKEMEYAMEVSEAHTDRRISSVWNQSRSSYSSRNAHLGSSGTVLVWCTIYISTGSISASSTSSRNGPVNCVHRVLQRLQLESWALRAGALGSGVLDLELLELEVMILKLESEQLESEQLEYEQLESELVKMKSDGAGGGGIRAGGGGIGAGGGGIGGSGLVEVESEDRSWWRWNRSWWRWNRSRTPADRYADTRRAQSRRFLVFYTRFQNMKMIIAVVILHRYLLETKGTTVEQLQAEFQRERDNRRN
ncbi:unnamed protein product [Caenorhabditis nigoni]